jgi:hypothetical protein
MQGGDGSFPEPRGSIAGYHALCYYGYDTEKLYLIHSWGDWCGRFGSVSKHYFDNTIQESVYLTILDSADVLIARDLYHTLTITVKDKSTQKSLSAEVSVDGIVVGKSPIKIAVEHDESYLVNVSCPGYKPQNKVCNDSKEEEIFELDIEPVPKNWFIRFIEWLKGVLKWQT